MIVRLFRRYATAAPTPIPITVPQSHFKKKKISNIRRVGQESSTQSHLETNIQISKCYAYCTARQYNLMLIENKILNQSEKYTVTSASMKDTSSEFLHVSVNDTADDTEFKRNFFIFKDGCLVSWNTTQAQVRNI